MKLSNIGTNLLESSLSRVWQHTQSDRPYAIISAFRPEYDYDKNAARNLRLASQIKAQGDGYFYLDGYWINDKGTPEESRTKEDSIFVIGRVGKDQEFHDFIVDKIAEYDQDGALIRTGDDIAVVDKNGNAVMDFDKLSPDKIGEVYSKLRGSGERTFMFENERDGLTWIGALTKTRKL